MSVAKARDLFLASDTLQSAACWCDATSTARVLFGVAPADYPRPFVVVQGNTDSAVFAGGTQYWHRPNGEVMAVGERNVPAGVMADDSAALLEAMDFWGRVADDIRAAAAADNPSSEFDESHLPVLSLRCEVVLNDPTYRPSLGMFSVARFSMAWGDG